MNLNWSSIGATGDFDIDSALASVAELERQCPRRTMPIAMFVGTAARERLRSMCETAQGPVFSSELFAMPVTCRDDLPEEMVLVEFADGHFEEVAMPEEA